MQRLHQYGYPVNAEYGYPVKGEGHAEQENHAEQKGTRIIDSKKETNDFFEDNSSDLTLTIEEQLHRINLVSKTTIPRIIWMTGKLNREDLSYSTKQTLNEIEEDNPTYTLMYMSDEATRAFIQKHMGSDVVHAFDTLIPGAYKADLARYCFMYLYGGVYSDLKQRILKPIDELIHMYALNNVLFVQDAPSDCVQISFMVAPPRLNVFKTAIDMVVQNVQQRYYGQDPISVTGPRLFGKALKKHSIELDFLLKQVTSRGRPYIVDSRTYTVIIVRKHAVEPSIPNKCNPNHYDSLWKACNVFEPNGSELDFVNNHLVKLLVTNTVIDVVPNIVWRTAKTLTPPLLNNNKQLEADNPGYSVLFLDDKDASKFLSERFPESVQKSFHALIPGAYKADLLRYCLLYEYGGIYSDVKHTFMKPLKELYTSDDTLVLTDDIPHGRHGRNSRVTYPGIQISLLIARPRQPVFKRAIEMIVENVTLQQYGNSFLDVTGPGLFFRALLSETSQEYTMLYKQTANGTLVDADDNVIVVCKPDSTKQAFQSGTYNHQWKQRRIFRNDQSSPDKTED
eukprot:g3465.t1